MSKSATTLWDRLRGGLVVIGQKINEEQFEAQLDAAIRSANQHIERAKEEAKVARADRLSAASKAASAKASQKDLENQVVALLHSRRTSQAKALTTDIAKAVEARQKWEAAERAAQESENEKTLAIELLDGQVKRLKYQLSVKRASTNLQRTQEALQRSGKRDEGSGVHPPEREPKKSKETPEDIFERLTRVASKSSSKQKQPDKSKAGKTK